jgi:hypothetical protein
MFGCLVGSLGVSNIALAFQWVIASERDVAKGDRQVEFGENEMVFGEFVICSQSDVI